MKYYLVLLLCILLVVILVLCIIGFVRSLVVRHQPPQKEFLNGTVPAPDGPYHGYVPGHEVSWQGKKFDRDRARGVNLIKQNEKILEQYPFKTETGIGIQDEIQVLKIDYDLPENPWWLRFILDEAVAGKDGTLIGKVHLRIIPGLPFTLGYFYLEKPDK